MRKAVAELDIPIDEQHEVADLKAKLAEAHAELVAAEAELDHLHGILNPMSWSSTHTPNVSELDALRARQQLPIAHERYLMAKVAVQETQPRYEQARAVALRAFMDARNRARLPILQRFASSLEAARAISDELIAFDQETVQLGGRPVDHPLPQLSDELPYRHGEATRVRQLVEQLEQQQ